jgi:hypothetical protein
LSVEGELYLVPLWHNELYFDAPNGGEIIVLCQPILPASVAIDEDNNIYVVKEINIMEELADIIKNKKGVSLSIEDKQFIVPTEQLLMKPEQLYVLRGQGIAAISEVDIYNITNKGDIIVKILLV